MVVLEAVDGMADAGGDRLARPLGVVAEPAAAAAQAQSAGELADERVAFGGRAGGTFGVVADGGVVAQAFCVGHPDDLAVVGDMPDRAVALEAVSCRSGQGGLAERGLLLRAQLR